MKLAVHSTSQLPFGTKKLLLKYYNFFFPYNDRLPRTHEWLAETGPGRIWFILLNGNQIVSNIAVHKRSIKLFNQEFQLAALGGVFTVVKYQKKGYGSQIVKHATEYILDPKNNFDVGVLFCAPTRINFYAKNGWKKLNNPSITIFNTQNQIIPQQEVTMIRYVSEKSQNMKKDFATQSLFFGETW